MAPSESRLGAGGLIDTNILVDHLAGHKRAQQALDAWAHRSISVVTWLELLSLCPAEALEATRGFPRSFERLSISESIADLALQLMRQHPGLPQSRALTWASAHANPLVFVTADPTHMPKADPGAAVPYRWAEAACGRTE